MQFALTPEQMELKSQAAALAADVIGPRAAEVDRTEQYPWHNVKDLTEAGFMGMTVPKELGGLGRSYLETTLVIEEMAAVCGVTGRIVVEGNMGAIAAILQYGTDAQRKLGAEHVLSGDKLAICITEPDAGSAATSMTTRADKRGNTFVLNGKKHWITGGGVSKLYLIFARVFDEDGSELGIGGFMARLGDDGLIIGEREPTMGLRGIPETEVIFKDLVVPEDMVLMPPRGFRHGFGDLLNAYNSQRVGAGTVALGVAEGAYRNAVNFAQEREQFGRPIAEFQGLQWMLADMNVQLAAARTLIHRAAASEGVDGSPFPDQMMAAQSKVFSADMAIKVTTDALQIFGARGYSRNLPMERMQRDARMFTIGGGTAQVLRTLVASNILERKLPQTRDGYTKLAELADLPKAAE